MHIPGIFMFLFLNVFCCNNPTINNNDATVITDYNFSKPDKIYILPDTLREISGITEIDSISFACIQDENGILFLYDALNNKIKEQYFFHIDGDYEGITRIDNTIYVLRSDGVLFEIKKFRSEKFKTTSYVTGIPANNNEGLCYDKKNHRLLIGCKGKPGKGIEYKDKRVIYGFDLKTKKLSNEPVFDFNLALIKQFAINNKIDLPYRNKKRGAINEPIIRFRTSAIGIHPLTNKLYLLSATEHLLFIFNMDGTIEHIETLDTELFNKAEGITFFNNGDMLISNEGQDKKPTLLQFNYKQKSGD